MKLNYLRMILKGMILLISYVLTIKVTLKESASGNELTKPIREWNEDCERLIKMDKKIYGNDIVV